ncbi:Ig-like domain-containing protein, partial [Rhodonellum psychrophilum]
NLPVGSFALTAKATDNKGTATVSSVVNINVVARKIEPKISFKTPSANSEYFRFEDISFEVAVDAPDAEIVKVEYFRNNILIGSNSEAPFNLKWRASTVGNLNIRAIATDEDGSTATSETLTVRVKNNTPPTISIISPVNNSKFNLGNNINIEVKASDSDGSVKKVEFFNEEQFIGEATQEPFNLELSDLAAGKYVFKAKATDDRGATTMSSTVSIEVFKEESAIIPVEIILPEIIIITPVNNQEFDAGANVEVMVMFQGSAETVKRVEYYSGSQLIGFSTTSPFDFIWQSPSSNQYSITAKAIGEDPTKFKISESVSIRVKEKNQTIFQITDPIKDAVFTAGQNISISVDLPEGNNPIERVDYFRGNTRIGSSTSFPYNFTWNNVKDGNYNLIAQLIYLDGTRIISIPVPIKVLKRNQSIVKLGSQNNKREILLGENLDLNVELVEFVNYVESVQYLLDGKILGISTENPYGFQWQNIPEGDHQVVARAIDASGASYYSEPINFRVLRDVNNIQLEYVLGPNPTTDYLNVIFTNLDGNYDFEFEVISMNGIVLKTFSANPEENTVNLDVADLKNGVYILQITANRNLVLSRRFVKK